MPNSRAIDTNSLIIFVVTLLLFGLSDMIQASEDHPFYKDIKEAYKDSKLTYNSEVERILYTKLPEPKGIFERSGHGSELPKFRSAEEEQIIVQTIEALYRQFFKKVKMGGQYCPVKKIKKHFAQTPKERIGISSGGYYRLFVSYWTLNVKLEENRQNNVSGYGYGNVYYVDSLLRDVEMTLAGLFFPSPGPGPIPIQTSESLRRQGVQELLNMFAPTMTIKELYEGADPQKARWPVLK
jgi:hypothetical protein